MTLCFFVWSLFFFSLSICTYTLYEGNNVIKCRILQLGACACSFLHIPCFSFAASSCFASDSRTTFCYAARRFLALSPSFFNVFYKVSRSIPLTKMSTLVLCEQRVRHIPFVHKRKKKVTRKTLITPACKAHVVPVTGTPLVPHFLSWTPGCGWSMSWPLIGKLKGV